MSDNTFTLDAIREETIRRYSPVKMELSDGSTVELKSILKLRQKAREEVFTLIKGINSIEEVEDDEDDELVKEWADLVCEEITKIFRLICAAPRRLTAELDHEDPQIKATLFTSVMTTWLTKSQSGEAVSSPS